MTKECIAAFDFDGTLTYRDSFLMFLIYTFGWSRLILKGLPLFPTFVLYFFGRISRTQAKEALLFQFFKGMPIDDMRKRANVFAEKKLPSLFRPEAIDRLRWHQDQGHQCLIVSASVDVWLEPWANINGIDRVLASRLEIDHNNCVTGKLKGRNCRREEKVKRLQEALGSLDQYTLYAYGDTKGDKEMLEEADHAYYRKFSEE